MSLNDISNKTSLFDLQRWLVLPGFVLLFLMLAFPMVREILYVKAVFFGIVLILVAIAGLLHARRRLHHWVALWTLFLAVVSFFFVLEGFFLGTPGATNAALVYVLWPLIYLVLVAGASQPKILLGLELILVLATIFIGIQGGVYLLTNMNILPENRYADLLSLGWEDQAIGFHEGYIGMQFPGLNSLPFLVPFAFAALATSALPSTRIPVRKVWLWLACSLGLLMVLMSGRRALILVTLLTPFLIWLFIFFQPINERHICRSSLARLTIVLAISVVVLTVGLNLVYQFDARSLFGRVSEGFDFGGTTVDEGAAARHEQYVALLHGWYENPFLGAGHGASAHGSIRSDERPWAYELSYLALLFQCGLLGFGAYAAGIAWIYWMGIRIIKDGGALGRSMLPLLVGLFCYLIANATNPYLARFDGIWVIFLPLTFINYGLLTRSHPVESAAGNTPPLIAQN